MSTQEYAHPDDSISPSSEVLTPSSATNDSRSPTPRSTPSVHGGLSFDPDVPVPSIEHDYITSSLSSSRPTPSTPSDSHVTVNNDRNASTYSVTDQLNNLSLSSQPTPQPSPTQTPRRSASQAIPSNPLLSPAVSVTPPPSSSALSANRVNDATPRRSLRGSTIDRLNDSLQNIHLDPGTPDTRRESTESRSRSGSRRRSGSQANRLPHSVADEEPPEALFHARGVQSALADAKGLSRNLVEVLSSSDLHNDPRSNIKRLLEQAKTLRDFRPPSTRTVGLVGDSGVGKSSLINSLLDRKDLARTSNSGSACTCVVTEYHYHDRDDFEIVVDYFSIDELKQQFSHLLQSYRQYHLERDQMEEDEKKEFEVRAELADYTFNAAFRNRLAHNERFLLNRPQNSVIDAMVDWTNQLFTRTRRAEDGSARESIPEVGQCSKRLIELTSESDDREASIWPFIRKIRVYLGAHILSKGLIIVDLPGLRDLNVARQNVTERYVRDCNEIFAVCCIGRASTDAGVKEVFALAKRARLANVGVICTKSDDIKAGEAEKDWPQERAFIRARRAEISREKEDLRGLEEEIAELEQETDDDTDDDINQLQQKYALRRSAERVKKSRDRHKFELQKYIIGIRNGKVTSALREQYRSETLGRHLNVFPVSNTIYWDHRSEAADVALPHLRLSGILALRKHCISIVAENHLRATTEYIKDSIPALLASMKLWIQSGAGDLSVERRKALRAVANSVQSSLDELKAPASALSAACRSTEDLFNDEVASHLRQHSRQWSQDARMASLEWQGWHHATYSAFCRNYGNHCTPAAGGTHCWNDEAMSEMVAHMNDRWGSFLEEVGTVHEDVSDAIRARFTDASQHLSNSPHFRNDQNSALRILNTTLSHQKNMVISEVNKLCDAFQDDLNSLHTDGFSGIRSSIIGQLMEASYRACNMEYGTGSDRRRKGIMTSRFSDITLFTSHRAKLREKLSARANNLQQMIEESVRTHVAAIERDLDTIRDENVILESERYPEFRTRLAEGVEEVQREMEDVQKRVEEVVNAAHRDVSMTG